MRGRRGQGEGEGWMRSENCSWLFIRGGVITLEVKTAACLNCSRWEDFFLYVYVFKHLNLKSTSEARVYCSFLKYNDFPFPITNPLSLDKKRKEKKKERQNSSRK